MATTTASHTALTTRLRDGRTLAYAEYGDPAGRPAFFFHGYPGSRISGALTHDGAARGGVRVICPDRPGSGQSTFKPGRTFLDWPRDVAELAAALSVDRFAVAGVSGGGPYAAACAYAIPERLTSASIISGVGPFDAPGATDGMSRQNKILFALGRRAPQLGGLVIRLMARMAKNPSPGLIDRMAKSMPASDQAALRQHPAVRGVLAEDFREAFRQGPRGAIQELRMYGRPWGFRLRDVAMSVHLWQGTADKNVPVAMGRYQADAIPNCDAHFLEGEGHLMFVTHIDEIIAAIT